MGKVMGKLGRTLTWAVPRGLLGVACWWLIARIKWWIDSVMNLPPSPVPSIASHTIHESGRVGTRADSIVARTRVATRVRSRFV